MQKSEFVYQEPFRLQDVTLDVTDSFGAKDTYRKKLKLIIFMIGGIILLLVLLTYYSGNKTTILPLLNKNSTEHHTENMEQDYLNIVWALILQGSLCFLGLMITELFLRRVTLLARELHSRKEHYNGSVAEIMKATLKSKYWRQEMMLAISTLGLVSMALYFNPHFWPDVLLRGLLLMAMLSLAWIICNFFDIAHHFQMRPAEKIGPQDNVGAALVWSYYYGYLKLILPTIQQRARDYEQQHKGVFMPVNKLLILMPESCFAPRRLDENPPDRGFLEHAQNLAPVVMARAGNSKREYQTPVYKIMTAEKAVYCIAEIPAFLQAMREMVKLSSETTFNEDLKNIWFEQACTVLEEILKRDETCRYSAEIIRYNDKLHGGKSCRVSELLLERIGHIRSQEVRNRP